MIDLDHFKTVNDRMGHLAGDRLLREFGAALQSGIRRHIDTAYRYGGDEFVVLLPGQSAPRAAQVAARLAKEGLKVLSPAGAGVSYGVASLPKTGSTEEFVKAADKRMYTMKSAERRSKKR